MPSPYRGTKALLMLGCHKSPNHAALLFTTPPMLAGGEILRGGRRLI